LLHNEDGHNTKRPVRDTAYSRVAVENANDDIVVNAVPLSTPVPLPEKGNGRALEGEEKQEEYAVNFNNNETDP
jgi:hypothetical protein